MKHDLTTIKTLIKTHDYLSYMISDYCIEHNNQEGIDYIANLKSLSLEIGKEYCRITADRNSMSVANVIDVSDAIRLVKDIEEGTYK